MKPFPAIDSKEEKPPFAIIMPQAKPRFCAAVLNLSLATSAGECARGYFVGDILAQRANVCVMQTAAVRLLRAHELSDFAFAAQNR